MEKLYNIKLDIVSCKLGHVLALLSSYLSLGLSKSLENIHKNLYLLNKSLKENKSYIDVRDNIELKNEIDKLNIEESEIYFKGHKIACELFEISCLLDEIIYLLKQDNINQDYIEYLENASKYANISGRIVNNELLCYNETIN